MHQCTYIKVVRERQNPWDTRNKKGMRAKQKPWNPRRVARVVERSLRPAEASYAEFAGGLGHGGMSMCVGADAATLASARVPPPGGGGRLGQLRFFHPWHAANMQAQARGPRAGWRASRSKAGPPAKPRRMKGGELLWCSYSQAVPKSDKGPGSAELQRTNGPNAKRQHSAGLRALRAHLGSQMCPGACNTDQTNTQEQRG